MLTLADQSSTSDAVADVFHARIEVQRLRRHGLQWSALMQATASDDIPSKICRT